MKTLQEPAQVLAAQKEIGAERAGEIIENLRPTAPLPPETWARAALS